jgi:hypothetical protein
MYKNAFGLMMLELTKYNIFIEPFILLWTLIF